MILVDVNLALVLHELERRGIGLGVGGQGASLMPAFQLFLVVIADIAVGHFLGIEIREVFLFDVQNHFVKRLLFLLILLILPAFLLPLRISECLVLIQQTLIDGILLFFTVNFLFVVLAEPLQQHLFLILLLPI